MHIDKCLNETFSCNNIFSILLQGTELHIPPLCLTIISLAVSWLTLLNAPPS